MAVPDSLKNKYWASLVGRAAELDEALQSASRGDAAAYATLCASLHKIKGEAQLLGLSTCAEIAEKTETIAKLRRASGIRPEDADPLAAGIAVLRELGTHAGRSDSLDDALMSLILHGRALRAAGGDA